MANRNPTLAALALLLASARAQPSCRVNGSFACYADAPVRPVSYLAIGPATALSVAECAAACAADGFTVVALTSNPTPAVFCYCGLSVAAGAERAPAASCSLACPGDPAPGENCGSPGFSAVYGLACDGPLPPAPVGPPLAPGRACSQPEVRGLPFCNASLPRAARVADLVSRLSLSELASQLQARSSSAVPRLGLPPFYWGSNNLHGLSGSNCRASTGRCPVSWPDGVAMTASFNNTAWRLMGAVAGVEMRALYNVVEANASSPGLGLTSWGPTINLLRDTRWGRSQEASSECPFVSGRYGAEISRGLQEGSDPRYLLAVSGLKHAFAYSLEQYGPPEDPARYMRQTFNAAVTPFDAGDSYYRPFRTAIVEGGAAGVMYAANEFQLWDPSTDPTPSPLGGGVPCCLSSYLRGVLASWNFTGYRCTDGGQIEQAVALHKYVPTLDQAIGLAARALSDIADGDDYSSGGLVHAYLNGNVSLAEAQQLLADSLDVRFRLGLFDDPAGQPYEEYGDADVGAPENWAAAALASREGLILLKNNGSLPLSPGARWARNGSLAVIGPHANNTLVLQGNYGGQYCANGPHGPATDCFPSIFTGLQQSYAPGAVFAQGCNIDSGDADLLAAAVAAASGADAVVAVLGLDQTLEREQLDRWNMTLPAAQQALFAALVAAADGARAPLIVVLVHGGALAIPEVKQGAGAIVDALYPGVTAGRPIADLLFGAFSPGGKLPYTVYDADYQYQYNFTNMSVAAPQMYTDPASGELLESPGGRTYRYYLGEPLWPFGFGLAYSSWLLAWGAAPPPASATVSPAAPAVAFSVALSNLAGGIAGDEVIEVFVEPDRASLAPAPPPFVPLRSLAGFARRSLAPGAAPADVPFLLAADEAFSLTRADGTRAPMNGARFVVRVCLGPGRGGELTFNVTTEGF
jgi:beta-glucosidase-like glycosyl hydrolase